MVPFLLSRTMKYVRVSNCHSPKLHHTRTSDRPGSSLSRNVLDDANSAGWHLPNRGRQHTLRSQQKGRRYRQQDGQGKGVTLRSKLPAIAAYSTPRGHAGHLLPNLEVC